MLARFAVDEVAYFAPGDGAALVASFQSDLRRPDICEIEQRLAFAFTPFALGKVDSVTRLIGLFRHISVNGLQRACANQVELLQRVSRYQCNGEQYGTLHFAKLARSLPAI